jgi:hypothetical protein
MRNQGLPSGVASLTSRRMSFYGALFAWLVIAAILTTGVVMATHGAFTLLLVGMGAFVFAFAKWGCASH